MYISEEQKQELLAIVFKEINETYATPMGKSIAAFWRVARGVGTYMMLYDKGEYNKGFFNLHYKSKYVPIKESSDGFVEIEKKLWDVWAYRWDYTKESPFATDPSTKTLLFENLLIREEDIEYPVLSKESEDFD